MTLGVKIKFPCKMNQIIVLQDLMFLNAVVFDCCLIS